MKIRKANTDDIPEIVNVLKLSLGEQDLPLSEKIWQFKHIFNPHGESIVLVALDKGIIIGVRAFMKWRWNLNNESYNTFRAVDTATHPDHQGKGVFKKLTLKAVELANENGGDFIFNTPNTQSRPGYLKMGWSDVGKLKVALRPAFNSFWRYPFKWDVFYNIHYSSNNEKIELLCREWNKKCIKSNKLFTPKSAAYLRWRYEQNPLQKYEIFATDDIYLAVYLKKRGKINELRIAECIYREEFKPVVKRKISDFCKKFGAHVISYSPELLTLDWNLIKSNIGPNFTIRNIRMVGHEEEKIENLKEWAYSLGDLELF